MKMRPLLLILFFTAILSLLSFESQAQINVVPDDIELAVLRNIYDSLSGSGWTTKTNWPTLESWPTSATSTDFKNWYGVTVTNGDITRLSMNSNNLTGLLPRSISLLSRLGYLSLGSNHITGTIPSSYGNLALLLQLDLYNNQISGSIPGGLSSLSNLTKLKLDLNLLSGSIPTSLGSLTSLVELYLSNNQLTGDIPSTLGSLINLQYLYLRNNQLSGTLPSSLGNLTKVQYLLIGNNQLTGSLPSTFSGLAELLIFDISKNNLSGILPSISSWTNITQLKVGYNGFAGAFPASVGSCTALTVLSAESNFFTSIPNEVINLPVINSVNFTNNELTAIPDFSTHVNKVNLSLYLASNKLDFGQLEAIYNKGIKSIVYIPQKALNDVVFIRVLPGGQLIIPARSPGVNGTIIWERKLDGSGAWIDVNSLNEDATQKTFKLSGFTDSDDGQFRYKMTNTLITGITIQSASIIVRSGYEVVWNQWPGFQNDSGILSKTATAGWGNAGAVSTNLFAVNQDGWIEFLPDQNSAASNYVIGFSTLDNDNSRASIAYGIEINSQSGQKVFIHETSESGTELGTWVTGDIFKLSRQGSTMKYYKNGAEIRSISVDPNKQYKIKALAFDGKAPIVTSSVLSDQIPDAIEFATLKDLYNNLGGASWTKKTNWPTNWTLPVDNGVYATWYGITVENGDIVSIKLPSNKLVGIIPESIGSLSKLKILSLDGNQLTKIPASIINLVKLEELNLWNNKLTGAIPQSIGNLSKLWYLNLAWNQLTGSIPESIGNLINLKNFILQQNSLTDLVPSSISNLTNLETLYFNQNQFTGQFPSINASKKLTVLELSQNKFSGVSALSDLPQLKTLNLYLNELAGQLPEMRGLSKLSLLNISSNQTLAPGLIPAWIQNLTSLTSLSLSKTNRTGSIPDSIGQLSLLQSLYLDNNQLQGSIPQSLGSLTKLSYLSLGHNLLTGEIPASLGNIASLGTIDLNNNKLTGSFPSTLSKTRVLNLSSNQLSGELPDVFQNWTKCISLILSNNNFTGVLPASISSMGVNAGFIEKVDVSNNKLTSIEPGFWQLLLYSAVSDYKVKIENNYFDFFTLEGALSSASYNLSFLSYSPQKNIPVANSKVQLSEGATLTLQTSPRGQYSSIIWEKQQSTGNWISINTSNEDPTGQTYKRSHTTESDIGTYRWRMTNSHLTSLTIQSEAIEVIVVDPIKVALERYAFQYKYDSRNRVTHKKVPGADWIYMVYDKRDRLVMTQDGNQRVKSTKEWTFTKYDALNRAVLTGTYKDTENKSQADMQLKIDDFYTAATVEGNTDEWYETTGTAVHGYTNQSFPKVSTETDYLTVTFYDDYTFRSLIPDASSFVYDKDQLPASGSDKAQDQIEFDRVKEQVTGSKVRNLDNNTWQWSVIYYDNHYRVIQTISHNHKDGTEKVTQVYDFVGKVRRAKTTHTISGSNSLAVTRKFEYDHAGRLMKIWHQTRTEPFVLLVQNEYNELGQLVTKKLHSTDPANTPDVQRKYKQVIDYRYNIRGWLSRINHPNLASDHTNDPKDHFGMELAYNNDIGIGTATPQFNGNISAMKWSTNQGLGFNDANLEIFEPTERGYTFKYDTMNRLLGAIHAERTTGWNASSSYHEDNINYDLNGNILSLARRGAKGIEMDALEYNYNGNQLMSVKDNGDIMEGFKDGNVSGDDFAYDYNGNMHADKNKSINTNGIQYNYMNLPSKIIKGTEGQIKYLYDATGRKLSQEVYNTADVLLKKTDYMGEFFYENDTLKFINHEEGRVVLTGTTPEYQYHLKDHLGNVRLTFTAKNEIETFQATLEDITRQQEQKTFEKYSHTTNDMLDHTDAGNVYDKVLVLNGGYSGQIGLAKSFTVVPGDTIIAKVYAKYQGGTGNASNLNGFATALTGAFGLTSGMPGEAGTAYHALNDYGTWIASGSKDDDDAAPKGFINILVFNKDFELVDLSYQQIDPASVQSGEIKAPHELLTAKTIIRQPGYVYVFLSNEGASEVQVGFDDMEIKYVHSGVIQQDEYYPFGLTFNSYSRKSLATNQYLYNGKELQEEFGLGWFDYGARMYDASICRWFAIDPKSDKYHTNSPYNYVLNNPVILIDPNGMDVKQIEGGYRYTEGDAKAVFSFLKTRKQNVYLAIIKSRALRESTNSDLAEKVHGQWSVFAAKNLKEALFLTRFYENKSMKNMVFESHGGQFANSGNTFLQTDADETVRALISNRDIRDYLSGTHNDLVADFQKLMNKIQDGGTLAITGCKVGQGQPGIELMKSFSTLGGDRFELLMNNGYGRISLGYTDPAMRKSYGIRINGSLSSREYLNTSWMGIQGGTIHYYKDVMVNRELGEPINKVEIVE